MNGKDLLDILLKYQYEGNLENMEIYYSGASEDYWSLKQIHSFDIDCQGDLILQL